MTEEDLLGFKNWFEEFTKKYYSSIEEEQRNILLKKEHSLRVHSNIREIAERLLLDDNDLRIAETIGLFHDIGRFPQYAQYKTFRDADSKNHGLLGRRTLVHEHVLEKIPGEEQALILRAVQFHGVMRVPTTLDARTLLFLKMIRDADKLDIFKVFIEYYESPVEKRASATAFGVPDSPEYSASMVDSIMKGKIASYSSIRTENDFRLMKLSWVFDINYEPTLRILSARGDLHKIYEWLPHTEDIRAAFNEIQKYISERTKNVCSS